MGTSFPRRPAGGSRCRAAHRGRCFPHGSHGVELRELIAHDHDERELDRAGSRRLLTAAALGGVVLAIIAIVASVFAIGARKPADRVTTVPTPAAAGLGATGAPAPSTAADQAAPTLADARGIMYHCATQPSSCTSARAWPG